MGVEGSVQGLKGLRVQGLCIGVKAFRNRSPGALSRKSPTEARPLGGSGDLVSKVISTFIGLLGCF